MTSLQIMIVLCLTINLVAYLSIINKLLLVVLSGFHIKVSPVVFKNGVLLSMTAGLHFGLRCEARKQAENSLFVQCVCNWGQGNECKSM